MRRKLPDRFTSYAAADYSIPIEAGKSKDVEASLTIPPRPGRRLKLALHARPRRPAPISGQLTIVGSRALRSRAKAGAQREAYAGRKPLTVVLRNDGSEVGATSNSMRRPGGWKSTSIPRLPQLAPARPRSQGDADPVAARDRGDYQRRSAPARPAGFPNRQFPHHRLD